MRPILLVLPILLSLMLTLTSSDIAFAEKYELVIPYGASDPSAPFFWLEESTGATTGVITVRPGDSVEWHNADTAFHTVTSVTAESFRSGEFEKDDVFDSGFFTAGKSYTQKFDEPGDFYYFCSLHPFMTGVVHVLKDSDSNIQSINGVGSGFTDDGSGFEVRYILDTSLERTVHISPDEGTITFTISGDTLSDNVTLFLPDGLIDNPNAVWVDEEMTDFEAKETPLGLEMVVPIEPHAKKIKIMGTHVIPEFGSIAILVSVLAVGLVSCLSLARFRLPVF